MWTGLAIIALILWIVVRDKIGYKSIQKNDSRLYIKESFITNKRAWLLGVFWIRTSFYTCVLAWLPPYYIDLGFKDTHAGLMLAFVCAMEVLSGLVLPAIASRSVDRRGVIFAALLAIIIGFWWHYSITNCITFVMGKFIRFWYRRYLSINFNCYYGSYQ